MSSSFFLKIKEEEEKLKECLKKCLIQSKRNNIRANDDFIDEIPSKPCFLYCKDGIDERRENIGFPSKK